ncbi:MAG: chromosome segregation protein SMC [Bacteroidetes bacterium]|nr:MAG: chromosome segregation protein SMC [Bacteroidota bacterium]TAG88420.1 MAG: chromosome segregation protein SMC [Bacteroidota bacterium]
MKITNIHLQNFRRFTDLHIQNIPITSKLVLVIGSNGSGKSSLFDAFELLNKIIRKDFSDFDYFKKIKENLLNVNIKFDNDINIDVSNKTMYNPMANLAKNSFYGRTSFRQIPRLTRTSLGQNNFDFELDNDRPRFFIDKDNRFENDLEKITGEILKAVFEENTSTDAIKQKYLSKINLAFENIFGGKNGTKLQITQIIPPLDGKVAQIIFKKGISEIHYDYLSAGEKEVFNLLINFISRGDYYQDSIYFLDEMDLHLNTKIQYNLLKEITENWLPKNCQLWTISHALGFIEYAKQSQEASILDFDDLDFDLPQVIFPENKESKDIYEIAVGRDFLPSLFKNMNIYFVENTDKQYYAHLNLENTIFVSAHNRNQVYQQVNNTKLKGIVDRDFLSDDDILEIKKEYPNLFILGYYSIENYFYHPDNLAEYYKNKNEIFDKTLYINDLINAKNEIKENIKVDIKNARCSYPYFAEPEYNGKPLQNRFKNKSENSEECTKVFKYLDSDVFEDFYKCLPMKDYCKHLAQRQNISKTDLSKTNWFKNAIVSMIQ